MNEQLRGRVPHLTAALSIVSLALVFAAAGRAIPQSILPAVPDVVLAAIPHVNAGISVLALTTISLGVYWIRRGDVARHRAAMLTSFALFGTFLALYLLRVAIVGPTSFAGPEWVASFVYYPMLAIHIVLAVAAIPLVYHALLLAATHDVAELSETRHPRVGRAAAALWTVSFVLGLSVYTLLYHVFPA
jgi:putative membrane protein